MVDHTDIYKIVQYTILILDLRTCRLEHEKIDILYLHSLGKVFLKRYIFLSSSYLLECCAGIVILLILSNCGNGIRKSLH